MLSKHAISIVTRGQNVSITAFTFYLFSLISIQGRTISMRSSCFPALDGSWPHHNSCPSERNSCEVLNCQVVSHATLCHISECLFGWNIYIYICVQYHRYRKTLRTLTLFVCFFYCTINISLMSFYLNFPLRLVNISLKLSEAMFLNWP